MKIEISEVFVNRTDSMTMDYQAIAVGIAALETRKKRHKPKIKSRLLTLFDGISRFLTPKIKKVFLRRGQPDAISISPYTTFYRLLPPSSTKKRIHFIKNDTRYRAAVKLL